jgi:uncharacterized protein YjiS (DUF1127 family)
MGALAIGRKYAKIGGSHQLREVENDHISDLGVEKRDIEVEIAYHWD